MENMVPRVMSEVSGRLAAVDDVIRKGFSLDEINMDGPELERICCAVWMIGYGAALEDISEMPGHDIDLGPLMEKWGIE